MGDADVGQYCSDSFNQVCGHDEAVKDKPYVLYFNPLKCFMPPAEMEECRGTTRLCVSECSKSTSFVFFDILKNGDTKGQLLGIEYKMKSCACRAYRGATH